MSQNSKPLGRAKYISLLLASTVLVSLGSMQISAGTPNEDKVNNTRGGDHISQMPEDILSFILSFLTMRDAVKTRVLSPSWRYLSSSTGNLYFDLFTLFGINYDGNYLSKNSDSLWEGNESASHIDRWISFALRMQVEKIDLDFSCIPRDRRGTYYMFGGLAKELPDLQVLSLGFVTTQVLPIPVNMTEFSHLKELKLILILSSDFDLLSVASILNASPCLLKFHLSLRHGSIRGPRVKRDYSKQLYYKLKEVEISGLCGRLDVLELAIYLLNNAIGLERMILEFQKRWRTVDEEEELESKKKQVHGVLSKEKPNVEIIVQ
ncbi:hypothetical protein IFM89_034258 [Coptis chinensis]|uniref:F-box domain-containing protein n=1 Tax=Coptis chinensis TaxID=261450 RepID=A0A835H8J2_9MAGN|nr:hypothetical protein IFM89_034258 [Coptis chinensis]